MAGPKLAFLSYFTLYFTLARVILLGQEIDFKSPFLLLTAPCHPPFPGLCPLSLSLQSPPPTHTLQHPLYTHIHTQLFSTLGIFSVPKSIYDNWLHLGH